MRRDISAFPIAFGLARIGRLIRTMIDVHCTCGTRLQLGDEWAGRQGRCPRCGQPLEIPRPKPAAPTAARAAPPAANPATPKVARSAPVAAPPRPAKSVRAAPAPPATLPPVAAMESNVESMEVESLNADSIPEVSMFEPAPPPLASPLDSPLPPAAPMPPTFGAPTRPTPTLRSASVVDKFRRLPATIWAAVGGGVLLLLIVGFAVWNATGDSTETVVAEESEQANNGSSTANAATNNNPAQSNERPSHNPSPASTSNDSATSVGPLPAESHEEPPTQTNPEVATTTVPPPISPDESNAGNPATSGSAQVTATPRPRPRPRAPQGLSGVSREYDDLHCQRIQHQFGVRVPNGATIIEVNGEVLPLLDVSQLSEVRSPYLLLPRGTHQVRFRPRERAIEVKVDESFHDTYSKMRQFFDAGGQTRIGELLSRGARAMDVHQAPYLLNLHGGAYAQQDQWAAAERKFRRALRVNPLFAPAHLNMAYALHRRGDQAGAERELMLADALNVGNVCGIAPGIVQLRRELNLEITEIKPASLNVATYISLESLSADDEHLIALVEAISKYAVLDEERAKVLNNLGAHFADSGKPERALAHYRDALGALKFAGPDRFQLAEQVLGHMSQACRQANFAEADEYEQMKGAVLP